jgi:hypothetical protein
MTDRNVILTGIPRSGTTLTCHLLNQLPSVVALNEPMRPHELAGLTGSDLADKVREFFTGQRRQIAETGTAASRSHNGIVPANNRGDALDENGQRVKLVNGTSIAVTDPQRRFDLFIKHPSFFTACLASLVKEFPCYAIVRNPLSVLLSWRNIDIEVSRGRAPAAELFDFDLAKRLEAEPNVVERQLVLLDFFYSCFAHYLPGDVIRYEDVVASNGRALSSLHSDALRLDVPLQSRNRHFMPLDGTAQTLAARLISHDNACWRFYARAEVEALLI